VKKNEPKTSFDKAMFSTIGNVGIAGNRLVNKQPNSPFAQGGSLPSGYTAQRLDICVNGVAGHMMVIGTAPVAG
jgi:hypothetical protein